MKSFFNELIENVIVLSKQKKIVFINKELREKMGYFIEEDLTEEILNKSIRIEKDFVLISCKEDELIKATYNINTLGISNDEYYVVKVNWVGDKISQLMNIEKFVDGIEAWVCIKDLEKNCIYVNSACANYYNVSKEEARKIIDFELSDGEFSDIISKNNEYIKSRESSYISDITINRMGIDEEYEMLGYPLLNNENKIDFIALVLRDQTFSKNVQLQTIKSLEILENNKKHGMDVEEYKDNLLNGLKQIFKFYFKTDWFNIWEYSDEEKCIIPYFFNNRIKQVLKEVKSVHISDENIADFITGRYEEVKYVNPKEVFNIEENKEFEKYYVLTQPIIYGEEFVGLVSINYESFNILKSINKELIKDLSNQVGFIVKHIRFLKRLNEEIAKKEKVRSELEEFIDVATDVIVKVDKDGKFISVSTGVIDALGWSKDEILNMKWMDIVHPEDLKETVNLVHYFKENSGERLSHINRLRCADGSYKWINWGKGFYKIEQGYILSSGRDITREKELELKENLVEKSIELERVRTEFFANLSHELKTPLTLIMAVVQVVEKYVHEFEDKDKKSNFERYINVLKQNSYRLLRLVTNLIDVTRIDAGFYQLNPQNNNIVEVVEDIVMSVVTYCEGKNINLIFNTETEEEIISCDGDQIERVILNILSNAIKFTDADGKIYVDISLNEKDVVIKVEDSGIGIAKEKLEFIFDRFTQIDNLMTRKCEGSGIGLSLVKSIIELHNGTINVESVEGLGSTFIVTLPRKKIVVDDNYVDNKIDDVDGKLERCIIEFSDIYDL